ncbi:MAG: A/G-specific adenine glycosylase [Alphaproteobacteria bacterium]|nr:A/G-specific adenine glycosylase [Alphaproteobacteria bacterium]
MIPAAAAPDRAVDPLSEARESLRISLLDWYDRLGRSLPWRVSPEARACGQVPDPYRVWLSEVMLQQTTAAAVGPYFAKFLKRFPTVHALADAPREAVLETWAGLGYYSRARNLHAAAQALARDGFPKDEAGWRALPGVGAYTAAAVAAIALDQPANVVDGNVERVMARLFAVETPLPDAKPILRDHAACLVGEDRPGDWAQALMDLGATVCTPKAPKCDLCPWRSVCAAHRSGAPQRFPFKRPKAERPQRFGAAYWLERGKSVLLVRRPDKGLLGGMLALPSTDWRSDVIADADIQRLAPAPGAWRACGSVRHVFTHFALTLDVFAMRDDTCALDGEWTRTSALSGLPTVFRKAAERAMGAR